MQDLQVVISCTQQGRSLYPLADTLPKYLLPLAHKPLLAYILENLERFGAREIIIVVNHTTHSLIKDFTDRRYSSLTSNLNLKLFCPESNLPIIDVLPLLWEEGLLKRDFVYLKGDVVADLDFFKVIDRHYGNRAGITLVMQKDEAPPKGKAPKVRAFDSGLKSERYLYLLEEDTDRLLGAIDPFDSLSKGISLKSSILARHPSVQFYSNLVSKGAAICSIKICKILKELGKNFGSFDEDFVSFLAANQYNKRLHEVINRRDTLKEAFAEMSSSPRRAQDNPSRYGSQVDIPARIFDSTEREDPFRPFVYITEDFSLRVKTLADFHQISMLRINKIAANKPIEGYPVETWGTKTNNDCCKGAWQGLEIEDGSGKYWVVGGEKKEEPKTETQQAKKEIPENKDSKGPKEEKTKGFALKEKSQTTTDDMGSKADHKADKKLAKQLRKEAALKKEAELLAGKGQGDKDKPKEDKKEEKSKAKEDKKNDKAEENKAKKDAKAEEKAKKEEKEKAEEKSKAEKNAEVKEKPSETPKPAEGTPTKKTSDRERVDKAPPNVKLAKIDLNLCDEDSRVHCSTQLVRCLIGKHVRIGKNCKVVNSILMDGVTIGDGSKIDSCILSKDSVVEAACELLEITTKQGSKIPEKSKYEKEVL